MDRAESFDALMGDVSTATDRGDDPFLALDDNDIDDPSERQVIAWTVSTETLPGGPPGRRVPGPRRGHQD